MGSIPDLKKRNLLGVISLIRRQGIVTKQDVSQHMKISSVSAHSFINELLANGMLVEDGYDSTGVGRKATLYKLNNNFGYVIGQYLLPNRVTTSVFDFASNEITSFDYTREFKSQDELFSSVLEQLKLAMSVYTGEHGCCLGAGFAVSGFVDHRKGLLRKFMSYPNVVNVPFKEMFEKEVDIPVFIGNDNQLSVLAIKWLEEKHSSSCIAFIGIGDGVGSGVLLEGNVLVGSGSGAGEIGHMTIEIDGSKCRCGSQGCLETRISETSIIKVVTKQMEIAYGTEDIQSVTMDHVISLANSKVPFINKELMTACSYLAICIDNVVKAYDPEEIIIDCSYLRDIPGLFDYLQEKVYSSPWCTTDKLTLRLNTIKNIYSTGAAMQVLDNIYMPSSENLLLKRL